MRVERRGILGMGLLAVLGACWRPVQAKLPAYANIAEFRAIIMAAFKKEPGVVSVTADPSDPAKFQVVTGAGPVTADVTNIYGYINAYPEENAEKIVANFVSSLVRPERKVDDRNLVAVIRTKQYIDQILAGGLNVLHESAGADLAILYMADLPDAMSPVMANDMPGRDLASVRKAALNNVEQWLPKVVSDGQLGDGVLYYVEGNTMLSTSLILLDDFWKSVAGRFPGDALIALPRKDQLFLFDDRPEVRAGVRRLINATMEDNFNLLSPQLYARRAGKIVAVTD